MFSKEAELLKQIDESRKAIRQKHLQLKVGLSDIQDEVSKVFKPIVQPLDKIAGKSTKFEKQVHSTPIKSKHSLFSTVAQGDDDDSEDDEEDEYETDYFQKSEPVSQLQQSKKNISPDFHQALHSTAHEHLQQAPKDSPSISAASNLNDIVTKYLKDLEDRDFHSDTNYGVRKLLSGYKFGSAEIYVTGDKINIGNIQYDTTPGLVELLFRKNPDKTVIQEADISKYQQMARNTNLMRKHYKPDTSFKNPTFSNKFNLYLSNLLPSTMKDSSGSGLPKFMIARRKEYPLDFRYWDDPNELVDRLRLLIAERSAGNNNHDNEIHAIIEELKEAKIIV